MLATEKADFAIINIGNLYTFGADNQKAFYGDSMRRQIPIADGTVIASQGKISYAGVTDESVSALAQSAAIVIDGKGKCVIPGLIDSHTHLMFAGNRRKEMLMRLEGRSYMDIHNSGGGIMSSVRDTRAASDDELYDLAVQRLRRMLENGVTTVEIKTGYGLSVQEELRQLRIIERLKHDVTWCDIFITFMGAHSVPDDFAGRQDAYVALVSDIMMPQAAAIADFCDVFTEAGVFSVEESRRILNAAKRHGLQLKIHADELSDLGGARLAAQVGAVSADHLLHASEEGIAMMRDAGCICTLLPGTPFCLFEDRLADARKMIGLGAALAIATDYNPGSCMMDSLPFAMNLALYKMRMYPEEVFAAVTRNAAFALGSSESRGSLERGKNADIVILDCIDLADYFYKTAANHLAYVIKSGEIVFLKNQCRRNEVC